MRCEKLKKVVKWTGWFRTWYHHFFQFFFCHNNTTVDHQTIIRIVVRFLVSNDDITQRSGIYSSLSIQAHWHTGMTTNQKELFLVRNPDGIGLSLWQLYLLTIGLIPGAQRRFAGKGLHNFGTYAKKVWQKRDFMQIRPFVHHFNGCFWRGKNVLCA